MTEQISGVYAIRCGATGKVYIGSSADIQKRWEQHRSLLLAGKHPNTHLQSAWNKYGAEHFAFEVVEKVEPNSLLGREQHWMGETQCCDPGHGYNIATTAGRGPGAYPKDVDAALDKALRAVEHRLALCRKQNIGKHAERQDIFRRIDALQEQAEIYLCEAPDYPEDEE